MKNKSSGNKRRNKEKGSKPDVVNFDNEACKPDDAGVEKKRRKLLRTKKRQNDQRNEVEVAEVAEVDEISNVVEDTFSKDNSADTAGEKKRRKLRKKEKKNEKLKKAKIGKVVELHNEVGDGSSAHNGKSKRADKSKKKDHLSSERDSVGKGGQAEEDVYQISSGDEDCSRGMKKWMTDYYQSRPGLEILQQRIDDFITAHDAQEEQARKEREAQAAEGGWTVVVHQKGRKKTTDSESGITVGSATPAAVMDKMAKKKNKDVGLDFYRFQKREAQRTEIMMLQSKFEQDKKRIQQLRAARKFRPY